MKVTIEWEKTAPATFQSKCRRFSIVARFVKGTSSLRYFLWDFSAVPNGRIVCNSLEDAEQKAQELMEEPR